MFWAALIWVAQTPDVAVLAALQGIVSCCVTECDLDQNSWSIWYMLVQTAQWLWETE